MTKKTYTLTQLVDSVKSVINRTYSEHAYWVTAELVKLNIKGGHYYLELADSVEGFNTAHLVLKMAALSGGFPKFTEIGTGVITQA